MFDHFANGVGIPEGSKKQSQKEFRKYSAEADIWEYLIFLLSGIAWFKETLVLDVYELVSE